jgi:hypothetical protein
VIGTDSDKLSQILNNPDAMSQIFSMAQSLGLNTPSSPEQSEPQPAPPPPAMGEDFAHALPTMGEGFAGAMPMMDEGFVKAIMQLMQQSQKSDGKQETLLTALKPYLKPARREKIDRAVRLARISQLAGSTLREHGGLAGLFGK